MEDLNQKIRSGAAWSLVNLLLGRGASILFTLFLARLLTPDAFGLIAMMAIIIELSAMVTDSGIQQALIRSSSLSKSDLSTAFFTNIVLSIIAYLGLFLIAPVVSNFYSEPDLTSLIRIAGVVLFANSLATVQDALLRREMRFKAIMAATLSGTLVSGVIAVFLAYAGFGVWSLVFQMLASRSITVFLIWIQNSWRPTFEFDLASLKKMLNFGYKLLLEGIMDVLYRNSFFLVIGKLFSVELVGIYFLASRISEMIAPQIAAAVSQASVPALSKLQDDSDNLKKSYVQILNLTMFLVAPMVSGMIVLAPAGFDVILDEQWQEGAAFVQLLGLASLLYPVHLMNNNILIIKSRSDLVLKIGIIKRSASIAILVMAVPFGIFGILLGQIFVSMFSLLPNTYYTSKLIGYTLSEQLFDIVRPVIAATLSGAIVYVSISFFSLNPVNALFAGSLIGIVSYLLIASIVCKSSFILVREFLLSSLRLRQAK